MINKGRWIVSQTVDDFVIYQEDFDKKSKALRAFKKVTKVRKDNIKGVFHTKCYEQKYSEKEKIWVFKTLIAGCIQQNYKY